ncbi:hypothetical protein RRF57_008667 [Xylaria bambusicola]|uniref:Uncharacterized protein n=1 Tax=Xylaria bambusicola TaxID=326684 RepID=A0AAN7UNF8_9PEZI
MALYMRDSYTDVEWDNYLEAGLERGMTTNILQILFREEVETSSATALDTSTSKENILLKVERIATLVSDIIRIELQAKKHLLHSDLLYMGIT